MRVVVHEILCVCGFYLLSKFKLSFLCSKRNNGSISFCLLFWRGGGGETCFILLVVVLFIKKYLFINRDMLHSIDSWFQDKT